MSISPIYLSFYASQDFHKADELPDYHNFNARSSTRVVPACSTLRLFLDSQYHLLTKL